MGPNLKLAMFYLSLAAAILSAVLEFLTNYFHILT